MDKQNKIKIIVLVSFLILIFSYIILRQYLMYNKLKDGDVTVGKTLRLVSPGQHSFIEYEYYVNNIRYLGTIQPPPFSENIKFQNGKYIVVFNKKNPEINVLIFSKEATKLKLNITYDTIRIDKLLIKSALRDGSSKSKNN